MAEILMATVGQPIAQRLALIEQAIPRAPNMANIRMALHTLIDLQDVELAERAKPAASRRFYRFSRLWQGRQQAGLN